MIIRKTFTTTEMRKLLKGQGSQFPADDIRAALAYAADVIDALKRAHEAEMKRNAGKTIHAEGEKK